ncbi:MAG: PQQ-dependent catabolism-associated beta-propeller protein [Pseudomonadota bacterium]|nr:PQQ-dependent catabolism-associated beta-propeller protein [Pseudomonadota bacterium]
MRQIKLLFLIFTTFSICKISFAESLEYIIVTNEKSDTVSIVDIESFQIVKTIEIGDRPRGLGLSPDNSEIYVAVSGENKIKVIDPKTLEVTRNFYSGDDPESFAVHQNGLIFISNEEVAEASVIDPKSGNMVAKIKVGIEPEGVSISPDGSTIVVTSESSNMAHFISNSDYTITKNVLVGSRPRASCFSRKGKFVFVTSEISGEIYKIQVSDGSIADKLSLPNEMAKPKDIILGGDGKTLYVAGGRANMIYVIDSDKMEVINTIGVGRRVWGLALSTSGQYLFTTDGLDHQISVIDTDNQSVKTTVKVGQFPWGVMTFIP